MLLLIMYIINYSSLIYNNIFTNMLFFIILQCNLKIVLHHHDIYKILYYFNKYTESKISWNNYKRLWVEGITLHKFLSYKCNIEMWYYKLYYLYIIIYFLNTNKKRSQRSSYISVISSLRSLSNKTYRNITLPLG